MKKRLFFAMMLGLIFLTSACGHKKENMDEAETYILSAVSESENAAGISDRVTAYFDRYGVIDVRSIENTELETEYVWSFKNGTFYVFDTPGSEAQNTVTIGTGDNLKSAFFSFCSKLSSFDFLDTMIYSIEETGLGKAPDEHVYMAENGKKDDFIIACSEGYDAEIIYVKYGVEVRNVTPSSTEVPIMTPTVTPTVTPTEMLTVTLTRHPLYEDMYDIAARGTGENPIRKISLEGNEDRYAQLEKIANVIMEQTSNGRYGSVSPDSEMIFWLHDNVNSLEELVMYLVLSDYKYGEDDQGILSHVKDGWDMVGKAQLSLAYNLGMGEALSAVVNYLLEDDYDELGFISVVGGYGLMYNYLRQGDTYYLLDFHDLICDGIHNPGMSFEKFINDVINEYAEKICIWSGSSLTDPSCIKAALVHSTFINGVPSGEFNPQSNLESLGAIYAMKYYPGMDGVKVSALHDFCFNATVYTELENEYFDCFDSFDIYFPEYTEAQILWLNHSTNYLGKEWKFGGYIPPELVPWYANISPEAQSYVTESEMEKMTRQKDWRNIEAIKNHTCMEVGKRAKATFLLESGLSGYEIKKIMN